MTDCCDDEVYKRGTVVAVTGEATKNEVELVCAGLRPYLRDGVKLDWHYVGGRAVWEVLEESETGC